MPHSPGFRVAPHDVRPDAHLTDAGTCLADPRRQSGEHGGDDDARGRKLSGDLRVALTMIPLSVLDLATVATGSTAAQALRETVDIAGEVEQLGYHRLWVAEHHGMPAVASSAPAVLIAHLADATTTLRVGSGGVMLPNHAPLVVAEQFGTLEALHPGRIDLGLGRAPGTDQVTVRALRRSPDMQADRFPDDVVELINYLLPGEGAPSHPSANPGRGYLPEVWLLGSSLFSAQLAGILGLPFSFAYHFAPRAPRRRTARVPVELPALGAPRRTTSDGGSLRPLCTDPDRGTLALGFDGAQHLAAADGPAGPAPVTGGRRELRVQRCRKDGGRRRDGDAPHR